MSRPGAGKNVGFPKKTGKSFGGLGIGFVGLGWVVLFPSLRNIFSFQGPKDVYCDFSANDSGREKTRERMEARKYHVSQYHLNSGICTGKGFDYIRDYLF